MKQSALMSLHVVPPLHGTPPPQRQRRPFYQDLTFQVVAGMALGVAVGALWPDIGKELKPLGDVFIRLIQMVVGLIIFCTVTHGIASVRNLGKVGRIAIKGMIYFEVVTSVALVIGLVAINVLLQDFRMVWIDVNFWCKGPETRVESTLVSARARVLIQRKEFM